LARTQKSKEVSRAIINFFFLAGKYVTTGV